MHQEAWTKLVVSIRREYNTSRYVFMFFKKCVFNNFHIFCRSKRVWVYEDPCFIDGIKIGWGDVLDDF